MRKMFHYQDHEDTVNEGCLVGDSGVLLPFIYGRYHSWSGSHVLNQPDVFGITEGFLVTTWRLLLPVVSAYTSGAAQGGGGSFKDRKL